MDYQTFSPGSALQALIKCYWTLESPTEPNPEIQRIVPDGCMEMIFQYGDPYRQYREDGSSLIQPRCFVFGQITKPLEIAPTGRIGVFAVRFHPGGFDPLATIPIREMENRAVPLTELFGRAGETLEITISEAKTTAERIALIEAFLAERLVQPETADRIVKATVETMLQLNGQLTVEELSRQLNVNRRQLERKFSEKVGLSPKQLAKIIRLQTTLKMLFSNQFTSLTAIAYEGDYYDQAHFNKDFKEFTGLSPKQFYSGNLKMSALFFGNE